MLNWTSINFFNKNCDFPVSRRGFLKIGVLAGIAMAGASAGLLALPARKAEAKRRRNLKKILTKVLGDGVKGVERHHQIPERLAFNLARMRGQPPRLVRARKRLLRRAAKKAKKDRNGHSDRMPETVTHNLNLLLQIIARQRVNKKVKNSLIEAVIVTVLFSTGGVHFPETSSLHRKSVNARRALKNPNSDLPISDLKADKAYWLSQYRQANLIRSFEVFQSLRFPEVTINHVWKMCKQKAKKKRV